MSATKTNRENAIRHNEHKIKQAHRELQNLRDIRKQLNYHVDSHGKIHDGPAKGE